jgi:hypothetical protein
MKNVASDMHGSRNPTRQVADKKKTTRGLPGGLFFSKKGLQPSIYLRQQLSK